MQFAQHQYSERSFAPTPGDDLFPERTTSFGMMHPGAHGRRSVSAGRPRYYNKSCVSAGDSPIFSLASFSRDCYIAAMSDGQSGETRDDGALLRAVATRDKEAFQQLYTRHSLMLFGLAVKILSDRVEAEDVLQETFVQVWKTAASFDDQRGKPLAWFIMLTRSRAIDRLRSRKTRARLADSVGNDDSRIATGTTPADDAVASEAQRTVRNALGKLPEDQRVPIEMAYFGGLTQFEIAQKLSQPLGTVKTRIRTGMIHLREQLGSATARKGGRTP